MRVPYCPRLKATSVVFFLLGLVASLSYRRLESHAQARISAIVTSELICPNQREADLRRHFPEATHEEIQATLASLEHGEASALPIPEAKALWVVRTPGEYLVTAYSAIRLAVLWAPLAALASLFLLASLGASWEKTGGWLRSVISPWQVVVLLLLQMLFTASMSLHLADGHPLTDHTIYAATHARYLFAGSILWGLLASVDADLFRKRKIQIASLGLIALLTGLLLVFGKGPAGTKVRLDTPVGSFQPMEFLRVLFTLLLAGMLAERQARDKDLSPWKGVRRTVQDVALFALLVLFCVATGFAARDLGPVLVIVVATSCVLANYFLPDAQPFRAVLHGRFDRALVLVAVVAILLVALAHAPLPATFWSRVQNIRAPFQSAAIHGSDQVAIAIQAVASLTRSGLPPTSVTNYNKDFLPLFITTYGGSALLLAVTGVYMALAWVGLRAARVLLDLRFENLFGAMLAVGCIALLGSQVVLTYMGNFGIVPLSGMSLPWFSQGGSSILASCMLAGLMAAVLPTSLGLRPSPGMAPLTPRWAPKAMLALGALLGAVALIQVELIRLQSDALGPATIQAWHTVDPGRIPADMEFSEPSPAGSSRMIAYSPDGRTRRIEMPQQPPLFQIQLAYRNPALERASRNLRLGMLSDRNGVPLVLSRPLTQGEKDRLQGLLEGSDPLRPYCRQRRYYPLLQADALVGRPGEQYPYAVSAEADLQERLAGLPLSRKADGDVTAAWLLSVAPPFLHRHQFETTPADRALWEVHRGRQTPSPEDIRLSIDMKVQLALHKALEDQDQVYPARDSEVVDGVVLDPQGRLLAAVSSRPSTPPSSTPWREQNTALTHATALGSVIKGATFFATAQERPELLSRRFCCTPSGYLPVGCLPHAKRIHCLHDGGYGSHGWVVGLESLVRSCNECFSMFACELGADTLWGHFTRIFGLKKPTIYANDPQGRKHGHDLALSGFGQGAGTEMSPYQLAMGYHRLLNEVPAPSNDLLTLVPNAHGRLIWADPEPQENLVANSKAKEAQALLRQGLREVVTKGTLRRLANLPEQVIGKTGTPQRTRNDQTLLDSIVILQVPDHGTGNAYTIVVRGLGRGAGAGFATAVANQIIPTLTDRKEAIR